MDVPHRVAIRAVEEATGWPVSDPSGYMNNNHIFMENLTVSKIK